MTQTGGQKRPAADGIPCAGARELLPRHVSGELSADEQALFRAHILSCTECRDEYRTAIGMTARVGHALAAARFDRAKRERRVYARALPFKVGNFGRTKKGYWMRAMIGTALLITLVTRLPGWTRTPMLEATWVHGNVRAGAKVLSGGDRESDLVTGDWVVTSPDGSALVEGFGGRIELGAGTALLVEKPKGCRVRFQRGSIEVRGQALVATQFGFASLDGGQARLSSTYEGLEISVLKGTLEWTHPSGVEHLKQGETGLAQHPGPLLAER